MINQLNAFIKTKGADFYKVLINGPFLEKPGRRCGISCWNIGWIDVMLWSIFIPPIAELIKNLH